MFLTLGWQTFLARYAEDKPIYTSCLFPYDVNIEEMGSNSLWFDMLECEVHGYETVNLL